MVGAVVVVARSVAGRVCYHQSGHSGEPRSSCDDRSEGVDLWIAISFVVVVVERGVLLVYSGPCLKSDFDFDFSS